VTIEGWYLEDELHRIDGPAWQEWKVVDGVTFLICEEWYLSGRLHRIDEPACREWQVVDGRVVLTLEAWYLNGQLHRTDGSAWRDWNVVVLFCEEWYLKGVKIHPRILRQPVRSIERWWQYQRRRRQQAIEESLWNSGMTVFMGLLREY